MSTLPAWFTEARFGMFIHYGLYSLAARHEWIKTYEFIDEASYDRYAKAFDPDQFDARELAATAKRFGAKYMVLTTKHHEGFCLWATKETDYSSQHLVGRDLVREFVDAAREFDLKVGLYHSLIDWHHPDFPIDRLHPRRRDADAQQQQGGRDITRYREYLHAQVRELLSEYGQIDYLFFDYTYPEPDDGWEGKSASDWDSETLLAMVRELQPGAIVNDRLGIPGDFVTPEQYQPSEAVTRNGEVVPWEACHTTNGSWGYDRDNIRHKSADTLIRSLIRSVALDGNLLLNVGPNGRGAISSPDRAILDEIGAWMRDHAHTIHGSGSSAHTPPREGVYTQRGDRLYLHLFDWPLGAVHLPGLAGLVEYAQFVHDASEVQYTVIDPEQEANLIRPGGQPAGTLTLELPVLRPAVAVPVIELFLREA